MQCHICPLGKLIIVFVRYDIIKSHYYLLISIAWKQDSANSMARLVRLILTQFLIILEFGHAVTNKLFLVPGPFILDI